MAGRHAGTVRLPGVVCPGCTQPVDIAEAMAVRPGELWFGPPMHDVCYRADVIVFAPVHGRESTSPNR